uniref:Ig-like domain-containing protein n=1 Tax=Pseudonaja textilis TaxID=8673 RepID=A0A670ZNK8_PSETE
TALYLNQGSGGIQTFLLPFTSFTISEPSQGLPHFVMLVDVDDHVLLHYDRETGKMQPRVSWIEKMSLSVSSEDTSNHNPSFLSDLHVVQVILSCDLQGDGSKRGFVQVAYNGESMTPPSTMDKSEMEECIALLEKFLSYGNETLLRTGEYLDPGWTFLLSDLFWAPGLQLDPPVVTVTRRVEAEDEKETHICRVHGFYPRVVNASWTRDGEVWLQDTLHGSVAPNADATYHYWLSIQIDPKERGRYKCHVEHDGLQEPLDVALKDEGQQGEKGWVLWQAGGLWEKNLTPAVSRCDPA